MGVLTASVALALMLVGTAALNGRPLATIVLGAVLAGLVLLITRGREVGVRRRARRAAAVPVGIGVGDARRGDEVSLTPPAGPDPSDADDVLPEDGLNPMPVDGRTSAALTCGVAGLFMFNVVFGPLAIALGLTSLGRGAPGRWGRPAALAAVVLGVADLLVFIVLLAARFAGGQFSRG